MPPSPVSTMRGSITKILSKRNRRGSQKEKHLTSDLGDSLSSRNITFDSSDSGSDDSGTSNASIDFKNTKWTDSTPKLEISSLESHDRSIVSNTTSKKQKNTKWIDSCSKLDISMFQSHDMNMVTSVTAATSNKWIDHCSKLDISAFQSCDMNMVSDKTNVTEDTNREWIDHCSKVDISSLQACDMDMVSNSRCRKENSQTHSSIGTLENQHNPATTLFFKINLKVIACLFLLSALVITRFPSTVRFSKEIEVRNKKQEPEHVVKSRKGILVRNFIPTMPGDGVVHF